MKTSNQIEIDFLCYENVHNYALCDDDWKLQCIYCANTYNVDT